MLAAMSRASVIGWLSIGLMVTATSAADFAECHTRALKYYQDALLNGTAVKTDDLFWRKELHGFKSEDSKRPLIVLTLKGCQRFCHNDPQYNDVIVAFQILTTWVLPAIALMSQLPYESLSFRWRKNLVAFGNWIGAPAAALTTTFWNIMLIHECAAKSGQFSIPGSERVIRDALYILSCINQYEYPRHNIANDDLHRDSALLKGILYPYFGHRAITERQRRLLGNLNEHLAFQLRLQRRRGVYPIFISIGWFGMAFAFSIVISFATLGDNSTAHSLALGLLLSWVPVMLFASAIDRNPTSATRCRELIQRWLFNVDQLLPASQLRNLPPILWQARRSSQNMAIDMTRFDIGEYMGQGRTLRYCGVADTVLARIRDPMHPTTDLPDLWLPTEHTRFRRNLTQRPWRWVAVWIISQGVVSISVGMAFIVSFMTPTQGLGCRSLLYLIWWLLVLPSWLVLGVFQEPRPKVRNFMVIFNLAGVAVLFAIMLVQSIGGLNSCVCKSSVFALAGLGGFGGYMDFENADFYKENYDVRAYWGSATGIGGAAMVLFISWLAWKWHKSSDLWRVTEYTTLRVDDEVSIEWLT